MFRYIISLFLMILMSGCQTCKDNGKNCTRFHDDGRAKPVALIIPMLDSSCYDVPWSLSEEFSSFIESSIKNTGKIFLQEKDDRAYFSSHHNPFGNNISWMKKSFKPGEFVIFLELVEHENISILKTVKDPTKVPASRRSASNLHMAIRLRIVDIRGDKPKIVLQEMLRDTCYMSNNIDNPDYNYIKWGSEEYKNSPMGIAHKNFAKEIVDRITDYVMLAKSR